MQFQLEGVNPTALIALLKETVLRFDDKLDLDEFVPDLDRKVARDKAAVSAGQGVEGGSGTQPVPVVSGGNDGNGTSAMPQADVAGGRTIRPEMAALFRGNGWRQKPVMSGCRLQAGMNDCRRLPHSICRRYGASGWSAKRDRHRPKWRGCRGRKRKRGCGRRHPEKECPLRRLPDRNFWKRLCRWWKNCWQKAGETDAAGRGITR